MVGALVELLDRLLMAHDGARRAGLRPPVAAEIQRELSVALGPRRFPVAAEEEALRDEAPVTAARVAGQVVLVQPPVPGEPLELLFQVFVPGVHIRRDDEP